MKEPELLNQVPYNVIEIAEELGVDRAKDRLWKYVDMQGVPDGVEEWPGFCACGFPSDLTRCVFADGVFWIGQCRKCDAVIWWKEPS
ncbi:hypothetical protein LLG39_15850 [bacterium]|nr:hypothetical protein [bacterium]